MLNKKHLWIGLTLLGALPVFPAETVAQAPVNLEMVVLPSITVTVDCDGLGGNQVPLTFNATTMTGTGSCATVTLKWVANIGDNLRATVTLTTPLTAGIAIPAANHEVKISGNKHGDLTAVTAFTPLSAPVVIWEEAVTKKRERKRNDKFSLDFQVNVSNFATLEPGAYNGQVDLTVAMF